MRLFDAQRIDKVLLNSKTLPYNDLHACVFSEFDTISPPQSKFIASPSANMFDNKLADPQTCSASESIWLALIELLAGVGVWHLPTMGHVVDDHGHSFVMPI
ncbi:hypothetical protein EVAR_23199_1 [Eumeta japonica]|uniref:Uncharacterized protein n=1 Tax=Eumeta variegata TaxID=151549 RepID=A0A4C1VF58_EUMVA|nr:hypothetical protein EVAR_23199_1 [Eumeta japonica]